jgi:glyoxylase-like metal-dependent hydrolase (beta-lactamase superfamily II)
MLNRRDFFQALLAAGAGAHFVLAQTNPPIQATKLSERLALLSGDGGNVAIVISEDGLMMVDGGFAGRASELVKMVAEHVDPRHIRTVFNTHWHLDHVGCNELLGAAGAKIIAHENVKTRLSQRIVMEALKRTVEPLKPEGLPTRTFAKGGEMTFGKERIVFEHVPPAHTDGDAWLFFPDPNVLHAGDLFFHGTYPFIDYSTGGWVGGMASASDALLKIGDAQTRIIPGHGPLASKDDLKASRDMLAAVRDRMETMAKQGKTVEEVIAAAPTKEFDARFSKGVRPDQFLTIAYTGVLRQKH